MPSFVIYAQSAVDSAWPGTRYPTYAELQQALTSAALGLRGALPGYDLGGFVGAPRVTRQASLTFLPGSPNRATRVAWLYSYPDAPGLPAAGRAQLDTNVRNYLRTNAAGALDAIPGTRGSWGDVEAFDYQPAQHGAAAWWQCAAGPAPNQCAAATATRDAFDLNQQVGGTSTIESPYGPQYVAAPPDFNPLTPLHPPSLPDFTRLLVVAGVLVGSGVLLYLLWPALAAARAGGRAASGALGAPGAGVRADGRPTLAAGAATRRGY